jgi:hypothetical protein
MSRGRVRVVGDDALNKTEASADAALATRFSSVDVNTDGYVSKAEYIAAVTQPPPTRPPYNQ